jgi:sugar lactone lactonase YvrE
MPRLQILPLLLLGVALVPATATAPPQAIQALAPVEVVLAGFGNLRGIVVDNAGNLYVADRGAGAVTRIAPDQTRTTLAAGLERPVGLAFDGHGRLLVAEERGGRVVRLDGGGRRTLVMGGVKQPRWLAVGDDGTLYVSARRITRDSDPEPDDESAEPEAILAQGAGGPLRLFADDFRRLQGLVATDGAVYAATAGQRTSRHADGVIFRIPILANGAGGTPRALGLADAFKRPVGLALDRLGALYLTTRTLDLVDDPARRAIVKLHPGGTLTRFASMLDDPQGIDIDNLGHLYVADGRSGRVLRFRAPAPATVTPLPDFTSLPVLTLRGSTEPGARLDLFTHDGTRVQGRSTASGAFTLSGALLPDRPNQLELFTTARGGDGLTAPSTEITTTHDAVPPALVFQAPPAGAFVRGTVPVHAQAHDAGSGAASLGLAAGGPPLLASLSPAPPAATLTATATWSTLAVPDGPQTLTATTTDRAGNSAAATRTIIVDNTPPDTQITHGPEGTINEASATFTFTGTDALTPAATLGLAWRLDAGPYSAFSTTGRATVTGLAPGSHVFAVKARDLAGNEDPTPAQRAFQVGGSRLTITQPADGAAVPAGLLLVRGTIDNAGADPAVSVNGVAARVSGRLWAVEIVLMPGPNLIVASAADPAGAPDTAAITVTATSAESALALRATPTHGVAPVHVTWQIANRTGRPLVRFELDAHGTGSFGAPVATLEGVPTTYTAPGLVFPTVRATDDQGGSHLATTVVQIEDAHAVASRFRGLWAGFKGRLLSGDQPGALAQLVPSLQPRIERVFQQLGADLPTVVAGLGDVWVLEQAGDMAETVLVQDEQGTPMLHFIYFRRDSRGRWLIEEM